MHDFSIKKVLHLKQLKQEIDDCSIDAHLPSINELIAQADYRNINPIAYYIQLDNRTIGATVLFKCPRKFHGFYLDTLSILGYDFFDYNFFFCEEEYVDQFLNYIVKDAEKYQVDYLILDNIFDSSKKKTQREEAVHIFDSKLATTKVGFDYLSKKKSVERHYKIAKKKLNYSYEHKVSNFSEEDIKKLAEIHMERWGYDDIESPFYSNERAGLYFTHCKNKVLTILRNGHDIIALHYGMILGKTFLWHTPAINVKYLAYSPMEILLFEIARFCEENKMAVLDFGLGHEAYKARFSNSVRHVHHRIFPVSIKGKLSHIVINCVNTSFVKSIGKKALYYAKNNYHSVKITRKRIIYYKFSGDNNKAYLKNEFQGCNLCVVTEFETLVDIFRQNKISVKRYQYNRIKSGNILFCLMRQQEMLCFGWGSRQPTFYVSEIKCLLCNKNKIMLYDFFTPEISRCCGYYTHLLGKICRLLSTEEIVIFAEHKNHASNKAIKKAGFATNAYQTI